MRYIDKSNLAYDLSYFETREKTQAKEEKKAEIKVLDPNRAKSGSALKCLVLAAVAMCLLFAFLGSKVALTEVNNAIIADKNALAEAQAETQRLQTVLDSKLTLKNIEEQAQAELGLEKIARNQIEYLAVESESLIEINPDVVESNSVVEIQNWFDDILEYLGF